MFFETDKLILPFIIIFKGARITKRHLKNKKEEEERIWGRIRNSIKYISPRYWGIHLKYIYCLDIEIYYTFNIVCCWYRDKWTLDQNREHWNKIYPYMDMCLLTNKILLIISPRWSVKNRLIKHPYGKKVNPSATSYINLR